MFRKFQSQVRTKAAKRAETNRRAGGRRTQKSVVKAWDVGGFLKALHVPVDSRDTQRFLDQALQKGEVRDRIVDVHSLLLFIKWSAERPKVDRRGEDIPGTFIGAVSLTLWFFLSYLLSPFQSQLKKLFFGVLRVRKVQDAEDSSLASKRPATTVLVYDAIKNRMDEALERARKYVSLFFWVSTSF